MIAASVYIPNCHEEIVTAIVISSIVYMSVEAVCNFWIMLCSLPSSFNYALGVCMYQLAANNSWVSAMPIMIQQGRPSQRTILYMGCTEFEPREITALSCHYCTVCTATFFARWMWFLSSSVFVCIKNLIALYTKIVQRIWLMEWMKHDWCL